MSRLVSDFRWLRQGVFWWDASGRARSIDHLDLSYVNNIIRFLEKRARALHNAYCMYVAFLPMPNPDTHAYDLALQEYDELIEQDPVEWLNQQPLMRSLKSRQLQLEEQEGPNPFG